AGGARAVVRRQRGGRVVDRQARAVARRAGDRGLVPAGARRRSAAALRSATHDERRRGHALEPTDPSHRYHDATRRGGWGNWRKRAAPLRPCAPAAYPRPAMRESPWNRWRGRALGLVLAWGP